MKKLKKRLNLLMEEGLRTMIFFDNIFCNRIQLVIVLYIFKEITNI